jgi:hypothetical protein
MRVTLAIRGGGQQDILLPAVPRKDEQIRLKNGAKSRAFVVELVEWQEGADEPPIIAVYEAPHGR